MEAGGLRTGSHHERVEHVAPSHWGLATYPCLLASIYHSLDGLGSLTGCRRPSNERKGYGEGVSADGRSGGMVAREERVQGG